MEVQLPDARHLSDEVLEALRLRALHGCESGFAESDVADLLGVSRETVSRWWSAYVGGGLDAVPHDRTGRPPGSGRMLAEEQERLVQDAIDEHAPEEQGIASPLWTRRAVRELILKMFGIEMAVRTVGEYLKRWGYTPQKPRRKNRRQAPEEVREWLEETYPALEARAAREDAEIHWCDEMGVGANDPPGRGYSRVGHTPELQVSGARFRVNMISTITNQGNLHFMTYTGTLNAAVFLTFLSRLLRGSDKKIFLIVDHLKAHESATVDDWIAQRTERIEVFYLPRRAPELNPDEYLNHDTKAGVNAVRMPNTQEELRSNLQRFMHKLVNLPNHIMNYFQHPCIQYAAAIDL
jgi:transposase